MHLFPEVVVFESDREEHKLFKQMLIAMHHINQTLKEIKDVMSTSLPGLDALAAADQKVADAITNLSAVITSAVAALQGTVNNAAEDAKVSDIAADFNSKADALNAVAKQLSDAVAPPAPTV